MAKKKKSDGDRGINKKGQTVSFEGKKVSFPAQSNVKPSEAFTSKGKMAAGLSGARNPNLASKPGSKSGVASQRGYNAVNKVASKVAQTALTAAVGGAVGKGAAAAIKGSYVLGKRVVHGSPQQGLKQIEPRTGSTARPNEKVNYSWNPKKTGGPQGTVNYASEYSRGGSIYVGKVPRGGIIRDEQTAPGVVVSRKPIKVTKEIKANDPKVFEKVDRAFPGSRLRAAKGVVRKSGSAVRRQRRDRISPV